MHEQITAWLRVGIARGELTPGERLPGERDLAERLGVSRMTLRQALAELKATGEIRRVPGRAGGAFIAEPSLEVDLTHLRGLTDQLQRAGRTAGARVLSAERTTPPKHVALALGISTRSRTYEICRVRCANGVPVALERSWLPATALPKLLGHDLTGSLYAVLREHYDREPVSAEEHLEPVLADEQEAQLLFVPVGAALMRVQRLATTSDGMSIEFARDVFRPDRVRFLVHRSPDTPVTLRAVSAH